jgi:hypothetical protein
MGKRTAADGLRTTRAMRRSSMATRVSAARSAAHERLPRSRPWEEAKRVQPSPSRAARRFMSRTKRRSEPAT